MDNSLGHNQASKKIYHEKQHLQFCLLHALNNLLQGNEVFTRAQLDAIANELTLIDPEKNIAWNPLSVVWKPHHNALTGNYDINVLFAALESKGKEVVWYDRRNTASSMDLNQSLIGIVLNKQVRKLGGLWRSRHWIALRKIDGVWHNLDSDLPAPLAFENGDEELRDYLDQILAQGGEALMVFEASSAPPNRAEQ
ncbi:hypothetical protein SUGI_0626290 [Cryptomeria japonica]|uniref:josephin-like protein isoform X2 n=1 Tax=Cryptomeria japonica TaxID=3369 RepID=UPI00241499C3|nr:josephin-like protein isoform X2 [Cryptomeria japonica]GLJ31232.1 hypothetical protein SUGI_0626290 [Cryptomeria japonica]